MRTRRFEREEATRPVPGLANIIGVLVRAVPGTAPALEARLKTLSGVEIHAVTDDGRLVVVIEDTADAMAVDRFSEIGAWADVAAASLVFHHFEDQAALDQPMAETVEGEFLA